MRVQSVWWLRRGQVLPGVPGKLKLENAALIGVKEVLALWNAVGMLGTHRATLPARWTNPSSVLPRLLHDMNAVADTVLKAGGPYRYQTASSIALSSHNHMMPQTMQKLLGPIGGDPKSIRPTIGNSLIYR